MRQAASLARRRTAREVLAVPVAEPEALQALLARHYTAQEIIRGLFAWAARPPVIEQCLTDAPLKLTGRIDRREIPSDAPEKLTATAKELAGHLCHASLAHLAAAVSKATAERAVAPNRLAYRVELAIAALRRSRPAQLRPDAAGIVILAATQMRITNLLNLADRARLEPATAPGEPSSRSRMLAQLGLDTRQREWFLLGTMDGVPVLRAPAISTLIVLDLASGVEWRTGSGLAAENGGKGLAVTLTPGSEEGARALLSPQVLDPATGDQARLSIEDEEKITADMTTVAIKLELPLAFAAAAGTKARVFVVDET
jgi:hypothetical protein